MQNSTDQTQSESGAIEQPGAFPLLFSPLNFGAITIKNRIISSAHQTGFAKDGHYTEQLISYHRERARGGAAVIVSQATAVVPGYSDLWNCDDSIIDEYQEVASAVGEYGAHYFAELFHPGRQSNYSGPGPGACFAPSAVPLAHHGIDYRVPHALEKSNIVEIVRAFGDAARRCQQGGLSGIELQFAHGALVEQFMSPQTNVRSDEWGGSLENRLRFAKEVALAVRAAAGSNFVIGARVTGAGLSAGEIDQSEMLEIVGTIDSWNLLDYFSVTMGNSSDALNTARLIPNMTFEPGLWARFGKGMKTVANVPIFLVGRVNHPRVAEQLLSEGCCDAVVMARALIADPYFPEKARTGKVADIRPCVGAMNCARHVSRGGDMPCVHNPVVGREKIWGGELDRVKDSRRVVVVGGGPSGLEAARVAGARGHEVVLLEQSSALGGQVRAAARAPERSELLQIVEWLVGQCEATGVLIELGVVGSLEKVKSLSPDVVVVATGSSMPRKEYSGQIPVVGLLEVLEGIRDIGSRIVVVDDFGDWQGFSVAHALAIRDVEVEFVTSTIFPGSALEVTNWRIAYEQMTALGVNFHPVSEVVRLDGSSVILRQGYGHSEVVLDRIDAIVSVTFPRADDELYYALKGLVPELHLIGDAFAPRGIEAGIFDGHAVGRAI